MRSASQVATASATAHDAVRDAGRKALLAALAPLVCNAPSVALLDFPAHANVGDSAIWLGTLAALRAVGARPPVYCCDGALYDRKALARAIGTGTILFTGGGSFGDLWEAHLLFRERVVADFPNNPIVQLPESVHFQHASSLARSRAVFNAHDRFTLLVRDATSLAFVQQEFRATTALVPDLAFGLGALARPARPTRRILWLKRLDKEDRWADTSVPEGVDWMDEPRTPLITWTDRLRAAAETRPWVHGLAGAAMQRVYPRLAAQRLARGVALLSSAHVVVTDRLHGHILAFLLGIPHVVLDNNYGKLHAFVAEWTHHSPLVHLAHSPADAARTAAMLAEQHDV